MELDDALSVYYAGATKGLTCVFSIVDLTLKQIMNFTLYVRKKQYVKRAHATVVDWRLGLIPKAVH